MSDTLALVLAWSEYLGLLAVLAVVLVTRGRR